MRLSKNLIQANMLSQIGLKLRDFLDFHKSFQFMSHTSCSSLLFIVVEASVLGKFLHRLPHRSRFVA